MRIIKIIWFFVKFIFGWWGFLLRYYGWTPAEIHADLMARSMVRNWGKPISKRKQYVDYSEFF